MMESVRAVAILGVACAAFAGCSTNSDGGPVDGDTGAAPSVGQSASPSDSGGEPGVAATGSPSESDSGVPGGPPPVEDAQDMPAPESQLAVVAGYLSARENQIGADSSNSTSWIDGAAPYMTGAHLAEVRDMYGVEGGSLGAEWYEAHENGWNMRVEDVKCSQPWGAQGGDNVLLRCAYKLVVVSPEGPVSPARLPFGWSWAGVQGKDLILEPAGDGWLVAGSGAPAS